MTDIGALFALFCYGLYSFLLLLLGIYGFHRYLLLYLYFKHKKNPPHPLQQYSEEELPFVTLQLPIFNEKYVVERLIDQVTSLDYPLEKLEIQILDDSNDETCSLLQKKVQEYAGFPFSYHHRSSRTGFKAGALAQGLLCAKGEFIAIFDADFLPHPQILKTSIPYFSDPHIGMVQSRWEHLNREYSLLTQIQAIYLDAHFFIEHTARHRSGCFFNFNGTAGIWRRSCIQSAGGWQDDTLTEDLDISYRAQLQGWKFVFLNDLASPAELPATIEAFKSQQHRWSKGSIQVALKLLPMLLSRPLPWKTKIEAFFHLTTNFTYFIMMFFSLLILPNLLLRKHYFLEGFPFFDFPILFFTTLSIATFYLVSQREQSPTPSWLRQVFLLPFIFSLAIGLCLNNGKAVFEALIGKNSDFIRTPKQALLGKMSLGYSTDYSSSKKKLYQKLLTALELFMAFYFILTFWISYHYEMYLLLPFLFLFFLGFFYVGGLSLFENGFYPIRKAFNRF
jgi:cellulose synthase/poly-beta-1,6-N-acetylglucosamine synthase-like glycosyltransferase